MSSPIDLDGTWRTSLQWGAASHVGGVRTTNEDSYFVSDRVCLVADGMGGHAAGEVASQVVVESFDSIVDSQPLDLLAFEPLLSEINTKIRRVGSVNGTSGMGTTVVGVALIANGDGLSAVIFNVGDSRCYRLVDGVLTQVTVDHSHVQELIEAGDITAEQATSHPLRNVVTRALGVDPTVRADYTVLDDVSCRLLLCSDGLSGELEEHVIHDLLAREPDPSAAALQLDEAVLTGRAPDNVTAVVVDVDVVLDSDPDDTLPAVLPAADIDITAPRSVAVGVARASTEALADEPNEETT